MHQDSTHFGLGRVLWSVVGAAGIAVACGAEPVQTADPNRLPETGPHIVTSTRDAEPLPRVHSLRTSIPPVIDGRLDDPCWTNSPVTDRFTQVDPHEGAAPTERTEL